MCQMNGRRVCEWEGFPGGVVPASPESDLFLNFQKVPRSSSLKGPEALGIRGWRRNGGGYLDTFCHASAGSRSGDQGWAVVNPFLQSAQINHEMPAGSKSGSCYCRMGERRGWRVGNLDPLGESSETDEARWVCDRKTSDAGIWRGHSGKKN